MTISASVVGTPKQPWVPSNQIADVEAGAVTMTDYGLGPGTSKALKLPSAAGVPSYSVSIMGVPSYWQLVNSMNPGVWNNWSFDPNAVCNSQALTNAAIQEWTTNPSSGHNLALGG